MTSFEGHQNYNTDAAISLVRRNSRNIRSVFKWNGWNIIMCECCSVRLRLSSHICHYCCFVVRPTHRQDTYHSCILPPHQLDAWSRYWYSGRRRLPSSHTTCMCVHISESGSVCRFAISDNFTTWSWIDFSGLEQLGKRRWKTAIIVVHAFLMWWTLVQPDFWATQNQLLLTLVFGRLRGDAP